jgi:hypothetical protein
MHWNAGVDFLNLNVEGIASSIIYLESEIDKRVVC